MEWVISLDNIDLLKLCDVIYRDTPFVIYLLNYFLKSVVQINNEKTQKYFSSVLSKLREAGHSYTKYCLSKNIFVVKYCIGENSGRVHI